MRTLLVWLGGIALAAVVVVNWAAPLPAGKGKLWHPAHGVYSEYGSDIWNLKPGQVVRTPRGPEPTLVTTCPYCGKDSTGVDMGVAVFQHSGGTIRKWHSQCWMETQAGREAGDV